VKSALKYAALLAGAVVFAYPFLWMLAGSLKPELEIAGLNLLSGILLPSELRTGAPEDPIARAFLNSIIVSAVTTASVVFFGRWSAQKPIISALYFSLIQDISTRVSSPRSMREQFSSRIFNRERPETQMKSPGYGQGLLFWRANRLSSAFRLFGQKHAKA